MKNLFLADLSLMTEEQIKDHLIDEYDATKAELNDFDILIAYESVGDCDSSSFFLLKNKKTGEFFENHGSHCSCYGFEEQFNPTKTEIKFLQSENFHFSCGDYDTDSIGNTIKVNNFMKTLNDDTKKYSFLDIFEQEGFYVADSFAPDVALFVKSNEVTHCNELFLVTFEPNTTSIIDQKCAFVYDGLVKKQYTKIHPKYKIIDCEGFMYDDYVTLQVGDQVATYGNENNFRIVVSRNNHLITVQDGYGEATFHVLNVKFLKQQS